MENEQNKRLTSAEISNLWTTYVNDTMALCVLGNAISKSKDSEIKTVLLTAFNISLEHIKKIKEIYIKEGHAVPKGFSDDDVNLNAPPLFTDSFYLHYVKQMGRVGLGAYSLGYVLSTRPDIRSFFREGINETCSLDEQATNLLLSKGLYSRPPYISIPTKIEYVEKSSFLGGLFGEQRPLLAVEATNLFSNIETISIAKALAMGFSQVAESEHVREIMLRAKEICYKHIATLGDVLSRSDLRIPTTFDDEVTSSTIAPFSDRLMMNQAATIAAIRLADYGASISTTLRQDVSAIYTKIVADVAVFAKDCSDFMIKNQWMEKPPQADDRDELARA